MTREDIIRMAREAGAAVGKPTPDAREIIFSQCMDVERFADLVASAEREACAKHVESLMTGNEHLTIVMGAIGDSIRARGQA